MKRLTSRNRTRAEKIMEREEFGKTLLRYGTLLHRFDIETPHGIVTIRQIWYEPHIYTHVMRNGQLQVIFGGEQNDAE